MTTPCCWPFCGIYQKECVCWEDAKKEVMQIDSDRQDDCESGTVAPPPVSEAGGDLRTNDEKTNMTDETCKENAEKLTVPLPEPSCYCEGIPTSPLWEYKKMIAYGDERARAAFARVAELEARLKDSEDVQFAMLGLIADIRKAAGDPEGKLMQAELVELIGRQREECDQMRAAESAAIAAGGGYE